MGKMIIKANGKYLFDWTGGEAEIAHILRDRQKAADTVGMTSTDELVVTV